MHLDGLTQEKRAKWQVGCLPGHPTTCFAGGPPTSSMVVLTNSQSLSSKSSAIVEISPACFVVVLLELLAPRLPMIYKGTAQFRPIHKLSEDTHKYRPNERRVRTSLRLSSRIYPRVSLCMLALSYYLLCNYSTFYSN